MLPFYVSKNLEGYVVLDRVDSKYLLAPLPKGKLFLVEGQDLVENYVFEGFEDFE